MIIDSPFMDEIKADIRAQAEAGAKALRESVLAALDVRFGPVPADRITALSSIADSTRLRALHRLAMTCPDLDAFAAGLTAGT